MTKRILAMVLVLAMVLSLVPTVVLAEGTDEVVASPKAGTHTDAGHSDDCGLTSGWKPWPGTEGTADTLPTSGQYYLTENITMAAGTEAIVDTADLTLCLNGYVIKAAEDKRIISTNGAYTLTICDCTAYEEDGVYYAGALTGGRSVVSGGGGAIFVRRKGTLNLYDGIITRNEDALNNTAGGGGAVALQGKSGNNAAGKMYMYGGELSNNTACYKTSTTGRSGGAIWIGTSGYLEITGGTIKDNRAGAGGAIYGTSSTVKLSNVTITGNEAYGTSDADGHVIGGSAIRAYGGMQLTIGNGTVITGNTSSGTSYGEGYGAAVLMGSASNKLTLSGKVFIADNTSPTTGVASVTFNKTDTDTLYVNELAAGSYVEFATPKTVPADADEVIAVSGTQTAAWSNGWVAHMAKDGTLSYIGYENGDFKFVDAHVHTLCSDTGCMDHTDRVLYEPWGDDDSEKGKLPTSGNWYLADHITVSTEALIGTATTLNLCLNGKTITGYSADKAHAYATTANVASVINISDCTAHEDNGEYKAGKFTGFTNTHTDSGAAGIFVRKGSTLHFFDGIIENCVSASGGAAIYLNQSTGYIYNGKITNNKAISGTTLKHGGGIFLYKANLTVYGGEISHNEANQGGGILMRDSTATICGGKITGNEATWGGGIAFYNDANTLDLQGGQITDNTASSNGGGIQGAFKNAVTKVSGNVVITGNKLTDDTANNVRLGSTGMLTIGQVGTEAQVGITASADRAFSNALSADLSTQFPSDDTAYMTYLNADNKLALKENTAPTPPPASTHKHTLCNDTGCTEHTGEVEYQPWPYDDRLPTDGEWYLEKDVTLSAETLIETATTLNLCLNGKTITGYSADKAHAYATTKGVASVINISDCQAKWDGDVYTAGKFTGFTNTHNDSGAAGFFIRKGSTLNFYDGIIENCASASGGAAIFLNESTANIYDGKIASNDAIDGSTKKHGGGIFLYKSSMTIHGGQISDNEANNGGGIYVYESALTINGGKISDNDASQGGGIYMYSSELTLKGGKINDNDADWGAGIAFGNGSCSLDMQGGQITGNTATANGGGIQAAYKYSTVKLSGDAIITGNTLTSGAANNVRLGTSGTVTVGDLGTNAQIGLTASAGRALSNELTSDLSAQFPSDDADYITYLNADNKLQLKSSFTHPHCVCGKTNCTDTTHEKVEYAAWRDATSLPPSGSYCLMTDVTVTEEVELSTDLNLCLHGHTITGYTGRGARAYSTDKDAQCTINITDCLAKTVDGVYTAGKITGFTNTHPDSGAGGIYIREGSTLNFYEGIIENCTSATGGAAIYVHTGTANIYGGLITGNKAYDDAEAKWKNGGGVFLYKATLNVYGGEISNNEANNGGGINLFDGACVLNILGGKITGNIAQNNGGGIQAAYAKATTNLSGEPIIMGNKLANGKANNLRLGGTGKMNVADLGEKASIGVTATAFRAISTKTSDYAKNFISDDTKLTVIYQDEVLYMSASGNHKHCLCTGATATGCEHDQVLYAEWDDPTSLPPSGNYYLSVDVTVPTQGRIGDATLNLCLNGHTVKVAENGGRAYYMTSGATLNISDCEGTGKFTNANLAAILTNAKGTDMEINLYNGTFSGNHSNGPGGALVIQGDCTFNMYGGKITDNTSTSYLKLDDNGQPKLDADGDQDYQSCNGGGLYTGSGTTFNMYGGEISGNKVTEVEYLKAGATSTSKAGGIGGGIAIYGTANLYGGKVSGNTGYTGGGIFVTGRGSVLNLLGTEVSGNSATYGGGIISQTHSVVNMKAGLITGNTASGGAGIYVSTGTTLNMTGGQIVANEATGNGGGVYVLSSTVNLSGGAVRDNKAKNGAGIYASATISGGTARAATINVMEGALITDNYATTNGGGIMMSGHSTMTAGEGSKIVMTGGEISKNQGKNAGGILTQTKSAFELSGGKIVNNTAYSGGGGGVYISTGTKFTMTGGSINSNVSTKSDGGGVYLLRSTAELKGGSINNNTAANGGGLKVGGAKVTISGTNFVGNKAVGKQVVNATTGETKTSGGNAGAINIGRAGYKKNGVQMYDTPVVNVYSMYVANNTAVAAAGAILVQSEGTIFNMYGGTVTNNSTENNTGGGIYFSSKTINTVTGGTISNNKAKNAAAMYFLNNTTNMSNVKVYGNEATNAAGAFTVSGKTTTVNMKNVEIYDNTAGGAGGAVVVQSYATWNLEDSKVYGNEAGSTAGAVYFSNPGYGNFKNVELYENEAQKQAGAVFVGTNSIVTMDNVTIRNNTANAEYGGGIYSRGRLVITNSKILNNEVKNGSGGGIGSYKVSSILLADDAGVFATNCIISGNKADLQGGGVYGHRGCPIYLTDCTITDNTSAAEGGGIFADGRMGLENVTVTGNTSGGEGFAVYLTPSEFDGHSYQAGHKRMGGDMIIKDNQGGDMYLGEGTALAVTGETLGEKSHVNITLHSGVLSQWVLGVYDYEGGNGVYTLTAGDRSITDPEPIPVAQEQTDDSEKAASGDTWLYVGIGLFVLAIVAVIVLLLKKKKAGKTATEATKE